MLSKLKKNKKGFTLVELIVVIAIITILAAIAVPTSLHFVNKAKDTKEESMLHGYAKQINTVIYDASLDDGIENNNSIIDLINEDDVKPANVASVFTISLDADNYLIVTMTGADRGQTVKYKSDSKVNLPSGVLDSELSLTFESNAWAEKPAA